MNDDPNTKTVGKYQFNSRFCLGEGAYGKVFLGVDKQANTQVAIKQIETKFIEQHDKYIKTQILSEIDILKRFNHPNIVRFIDLIETATHIFIVTEYCRDGDLKELLTTKRLNEQEAFIALLNITEGFKELQKNNIIHRDLKPANILIDNGIYKIADFGFAKAVVKLGSTHMLRSLVGSPYYMAPQLLANQQYCYKCDIWSLAVIYYEMVMGDLPWLASDPHSLLKKILQFPVTPKLKNSKLSNFSMYFLERCLTVDEHQRPSWDEVFSMIQQNPSYRMLQNLNSSPLMPAQEEEPTRRQAALVDSNSGSQTRSQLVEPPEEIMQEVEAYGQEVQRMRQELVFKHYLSTEMLVNKDEFVFICDDVNDVIKIVVVLGKMVTHLSLQLLAHVREKERKRPELFTLSKVLQKLKGLISQEHEFYCSFQRDLKDFLEREKLMDNVKFDNDLKPFLELDQYHIKDPLVRKRSGDLLLKYGQQFLKSVQTHMEGINRSLHEDDHATKSIITLIEQLMNLMRVSDLKEGTDVYFEDLYNTHNGQKDISLYMSILSTNMDALLLN